MNVEDERLLMDLYVQLEEALDKLVRILDEIHWRLK